MLAAIGLALTLAQRTDITFVRHAETLANSTGRYNSRTIDSFSEKGKAQVERLTQKLGAERFELILVSPSPRAMRTIAPYLKASHQVATIWPLLYECCTGRRPADAHPTQFSYGPKIKLPVELRAFFRLTPGDDRLPVAADYNSGLAQVQAALKQFNERHRGRKLLLVGHSGQGGQFLHGVTGKWTAIRNAVPIQVVVR